MMRSAKSLYGCCGSTDRAPIELWRDFQLNRRDTENISPNQYLYPHPAMNGAMVSLLQFPLYCCLPPSHSFV